MKNQLLTLLFMCMAFSGMSQVVFYAEEPAGVEGNYNMSYAVAGGGWGVNDLTDPANAVLDTLVFATDSLACTPLTNGPALDGNIAVVYRGSCEFGSKALEAESHGALAVVIINNVPGAPISMGGGADGPNVTIPVVMISQQDGATLRASYDNGDDIRVFLGSKNGYYADDIGITAKRAYRPKEGIRPAQISGGNTAYTHKVGGWVLNFGSNDQTNVNLHCKITNGGSTVYDESGTATSILSGDSANFNLPDFSLASYPTGHYTMMYTVTSDAPADEFTSDDTLYTNFYFGDQYSYATPDETTGEPAANNYIRPGGTPAPTTYSVCMHFRNSNASVLGTTGMYFSATMGNDINDNPQSIAGQFVEAKLYEWNDNFTDVNDPNFNISNLNQITSGDFSYTTDDQEVNKFIQFNEAVALVDNQRYLACIDLYSADIYVGFDNAVDYSYNYNDYAQPLFPINDGTQYYALGFGSDNAPAISLKTIDASAVSIEEEQEIEAIAPYPNPAKSNITIPTQGFKGNEAVMTIHSIDGKVVRTQNVTYANNIVVNVENLANGRYIIKLTNDQEVQSFNIVVSK